jgi:hypothetical protein
MPEKEEKKISHANPPRWHGECCADECVELGFICSAIEEGRDI